VPLTGLRSRWLAARRDLTSGQAARLGTATLLGMAIGAFIWATIADRIGRKVAFTATIAVFVVFTVGGAVTTDIVTFALLRFMAGFGLGGAIPVAYALVGECTPRTCRGRVLTAMEAWWPIGSALAGFISAWFVSMWADWRPPLLAMVLPAILLIFVRLWIPESPMFLIRNNRHREARAVIDGLVEATDAKPVKYRLE